MSVTIILIVIGALGTFPNRLEQRMEELEIGGRIKTIPTTAGLRAVPIL